MDDDGKVIPFGVRNVDRMLGGGVPAGSMVLLTTENGAGGREFAHTMLAQQSLAKHSPDKYEVKNQELRDKHKIPHEIHYLSLVRKPQDILRDTSSILTERQQEIFDSEVDMLDISDSYFSNTIVPKNWFSNRDITFDSLEQESQTLDTISRLTTFIDRNAEDNTVFIDSLNDLFEATEGHLEWSELLVFLKGLARKSMDWEGVIITALNKDTVSEQKYKAVSNIFDGIIEFKWDEEQEGSQRRTTMQIERFRGIMSSMGSEAKNMYETEARKGGLRVRKIESLKHEG